MDIQRLLSMPVMMARPVAPRNTFKSVTGVTGVVLGTQLGQN